MDVYIIAYTPKQPLMQETSEGADMIGEQTDPESDVEEVLRAMPVTQIGSERTRAAVDDNEGAGDDGAEVEAPIILGPRGFDKLPGDRVAQLSAYPAARLDLTYADGYGGQTARGNVHFVRGGDVVYPTGGVCVVHNRTTNTQMIFQKHERRITCSAVHVQGEIMATGDLGPDPMVFVWHSQTLQLVAQFQGLQPILKKEKEAAASRSANAPPQLGGVAALSFSASDSMVRSRCPLLVRVKRT
jgi:hypothetical protein